ncbi:urotensin-related peptide 1 isoform X2 [Scyliorhinus canicula]|uniref:urotensin-related peptide 1 isoform X2 n=1 Tax=Scyliorhinus canicula TaxID=7830 RepID=UPI0018F7820F|nr:urotensin-related peptide 1 isoform X2 [Scyliorhinus canicula]
MESTKPVQIIEYLLQEDVQFDEWFLFFLFWGEEFDPRMTEDAVGFLSNDLPSLGARRMADFYSAFPKQEEMVLDLGAAGPQEDTVETLGDNANLVDDMMALLWKLTAAQKLQHPRYTKSVKAALNPRKRACFWKYCVTD